MRIFYDEKRLEVLKAAVKGDCQKIEDLLKDYPQLIAARTTTTQSTMLHLAAKNGRNEVCKFLISRGHDINPVDKDEKTPLQTATEHGHQGTMLILRFVGLAKQYYAALVNEIKNNNPKIQVAVDPISPVEHIRSYGLDRLSVAPDSTVYSVMGTTNLYSPQKARALGRWPNVAPNRAILSTILRYDIADIPYYSDILILKEHALATLLVKPYLDSPNLAIKDIEPNQYNQYKACAYVIAVNKAIELYPFLKIPYPSAGDTSEQIEAKKLFIADILAPLEKLSSILNSRCRSNFEVTISNTVGNEAYKKAVSHVKQIMRQESRSQTIAITHEVYNKYVWSVLAKASPSAPTA